MTAPASGAPGSGAAPTATSTVAASEPLVLSDDEALAVTEVAVAYAAAVPTGREEPYRALAAAAASGSVAGHDLETLERICVLALETGKARQLGRAETERLLAAVYRRTPGGSSRLAEVGEVNRALAQLTGRPLTGARMSWQRPGRYGLELTVSGFALTLVIEPTGLEVQNLQTG